MLDLIMQLKGSERTRLLEMFKFTFDFEQVEHKSLASLLLQQDKELKYVIKQHREQLLEFLDKEKK